MIKHWCARILCLIIVPAILFIVPYFIHFKVLYKTGTGDKFMSSDFQMSLDGSFMSQPAECKIFLLIDIFNLKFFHRCLLWRKSDYKKQS